MVLLQVGLQVVGQKAGDVIRQGSIQYSGSYARFVLTADLLPPIHENGGSYLKINRLCTYRFALSLQISAKDAEEPIFWTPSRKTFSREALPRRINYHV